jgi:hypothetical protein
VLAVGSWGTTRGLQLIKNGASVEPGEGSKSTFFRATAMPDRTAVVFISKNCQAALQVGLQHFLRHFVGLGLIFATLSASLFLTVDRVGSSLKHVVQQRANQALAASGWQVEFESLQFVEGEGIRLRGLSLRCFAQETECWSIPVPNNWSEIQSLVKSGRLPEVSTNLVAQDSARHFARRPSFRPLVSNGHSIKVDSLWLRGAWSATELIQGHFRPTAIELDGILVDFRLGDDQHVHFPKLVLPPSSTSVTLPNSIAIGNVTVQISDKEGQPKYRWKGLSCQAVRLPHANPNKPIESVTATSSVGNEWQVDGQFNGLTDQPIHWGGRVDSLGYDLSVHCAPFYWHPQASANVLPWLPVQAQVLCGASGQVKLDQAKIRGFWPGRNEGNGSSGGTPATDVGWQKYGIEDFIANGQLNEVVIQHKLLPQPVLKAAANFQVNKAGVQVTDISGIVSEGAFTGWIELEDWFRPLVKLNLSGRRLPFNERWTGILTERMQHAWTTFRPEGHFDCDLMFVIQRDGSLNRSGSVDARDVRFLYREFPLPVSQINGRIDVENNNCRFTLEASDPRCPVVFEGWTNDMGPQWTGRIDIRSTRFHPYSEVLLDGLKKKPEAVQVIKQMNFAGMLAVNGFIERLRPDTPADVRFNVNVHGGEVRHQFFPYRMFGLAGMISLVNGTVTAENVEGVSSTGNISISGQVIPGKQWWVNVVGQALELNQELYQALSPAQRSVWQQLTPRGTLDHLLVRVQNVGSGVQVSVDGFQQPSTMRDPSNLQIEPSWFRYGLDRLSGKFHYSNGEIQITDVQGWHGNVPVSFDAVGQTHSEYWQMTVRDLLTGQIPIDHEIKEALPQSVQTAANRMQLTGSVAVQGTVSIFQRLKKSPLLPELVEAGAGPIGQVSFAAPIDDTITGPSLSWDLRLDVEDAAAVLGVPVNHIHGNVQARGLSNSETAYCGGQLDFDSAMIQGVQATTIQGPFWCNEENVLFGTAVGNLPVEVQAQTCGAMASLTGNSLGGRLSMDGQVWLQDEIRFQIQSTANQIDLACLAAEFAPETREIVGHGTASLVLNGTSTGMHTLDGQGMVRINNAKLYEIPFFLQLLKSSQVETPDNTAFDEGSIDFSIQGSDIECHRIELNGDAISLIGNGRANLNQELDLNFYTVLGRNRLYLPLVSDLVHAGSQQLLWISVKGTAEKPQLTRETFRALNEAVRLLLEEQE